MPTFGLLPSDVVANSRGDVEGGVTLSLYATQADALASTGLLASVTSDLLGRWTYTHATLGVVWVRTPAGIGSPSGDVYAAISPEGFIGATGPTGATGATGSTGPTGPVNTDASALATGTVADARLPVSAQAATLSSTFARVGPRRIFIDVTAAPYNATGNGSTDDTAAIQSAINAVDASFGGTVYFPPGQYQISATLTVAASEVKLLGSGGNGSRISVTANVDAISFAAGLSRCAIRDLWIGSFTTRSAGWAIKINGSSGTQSAYLDMQGVTVQNTFGGIYASWLNQSVWTNMRFIRSVTNGLTNQAVYMVGVKSHRLSHFVMTSTLGVVGSEGIRLDSECDTILITDGEIINFPGGIAGIYLLNSLGGANTGPRLVSMARILIESCNVGFYIGAGRFAKLTQCWGAANAAQGFILAGHDGVNMTDCEANQNGTAGYQIASGAGPYSLIGCNANYNSQTTNNVSAGLQIDPSVTHVKVIGGSFGNWLYSLANKQKYGININATGTDYIVIHGADTSVANVTLALNNLSTGTHNSVVNNI